MRSADPTETNGPFRSSTLGLARRKDVPERNLHGRVMRTFMHRHGRGLPWSRSVPFRTKHPLGALVNRPSVPTRTLDRGGFWAVIVTFEGKLSCVRLAQFVDEQAYDAPVGHWQSRLSPEWAPLTGDWRSSRDKTAHLAGVSHTAIGSRPVRSIR